MPGFLSELLDSYHSLLERHRNEPFLRGTMAACALIATADGEISFSQRMRIDQILETLDALKVFDPHVGVNLFNEYSQAIFDNPRQGREQALACVKQVASEDKEKAELMIRICLAVSEADGVISTVEQIEIVTLCGQLELPPRHCGLYTDKDAAPLLDPSDRDPGPDQ